MTEELIRSLGMPRSKLGTPYSKTDFDWWRKLNEQSTDLAIEQARGAASTLEVLLLAAARPGAGRITDRLPAVWMSFLEWCEQTCQDFRLRGQIDEVLAKRKFKDRVTMTWGEARQHQSGAEGRILRGYYGFKDDKRKLDNEELTLEVETCPSWHPASDMTGRDRTETGGWLFDRPTEQKPRRSAPAKHFHPVQPTAKPAKRKAARR